MPPDDRLKPGRHDVGAPPPRAQGNPPTPGEDAPPASIRLPNPAGNWLRGQFHCPFCLRIIEASVIGLSSFLGPSLLQCRHCGGTMTSHRREWRDKSTAGRAWYVALSLFYVALAAVLAFVFTLFACLVLAAPDGWPPLSAAILWGSAVAAHQVFRVTRSLGRTRSEERPAYRLTFWSPDSSLSQKVFIGVLLFSFLWAWLARLFSSVLKPARPLLDKTSQARNARRREPRRRPCADPSPCCASYPCSRWPSGPPLRGGARRRGSRSA